MEEMAERVHAVWRVCDALVYIPLTTLFVSFWIFFATWERGPTVLYNFYAGSRNAADAHCGIVVLASMVFGLYCTTLFLPKRRLLGIISRRTTLIASVLLVLLAISTFFASASCLAGVRM